MVAILIRRCVKAGMEPVFLAKYKHPEHEDFIGETLTKVSPKDYPSKLTNLPVACKEGTTYLNIALWKSAESFYTTFEASINKPLSPEDAECERSRIVLDVEQSSAVLSDLLNRKD